jgi:hypothetical protein
MKSILKKIYILPNDIKMRIVSYLPIVPEELKIVHQIIKNYHTYIITELFHNYYIKHDNLLYYYLEIDIHTWIEDVRKLYFMEEINNLDVDIHKMEKEKLSKRIKDKYNIREIYSLPDNEHRTQRLLNILFYISMKDIQMFYKYTINKYNLYTSIYL